MTEVKQHRSLRDAFGQFATGVTVVTTRDKEGKPVGMTANSFASVSLEPPLVSWCVDKSSTRFSEFTDAEYFTISVLTSAQQETSNLFAMRSWDATVFDDAEWFEGLNKVPQIPDVSARFHCQTAHLYEGGDHIIIVGAVLEYESDADQPLVFFQGDYRQLT
jgi:3-hydroxy-9,10-secoandrosta-1,3,5(10)-triene-9,17-dione monooxygenase reductase component